jgi:anti-sigma B factor antagonist
MRYQKEIIDHIAVIRIQEPQITMKEAPDVKTALLGLMLEKESCILLNMREVHKMDSTGLGALLFGIRQAEQHDKDLSVCDLNEKVKFIIRIARLEEVIDVYDSEGMAIDLIRKECGDEHTS